VLAVWTYQSFHQAPGHPSESTGVVRTEPIDVAPSQSAAVLRPQALDAARPQSVDVVRPPPIDVAEAGKPPAKELEDEEDAKVADTAQLRARAEAAQAFAADRARRRERLQRFRAKRAARMHRHQLEAQRTQAAVATAGIVAASADEPQIALTKPDDVQRYVAKGKGAEGLTALDSNQRLPWFGSPEDLSKRPGWHRYMSAVYGTSVNNAALYPINVHKFHLLYGSVLGSSMIKGIQPISANLNLGTRTGVEFKGRTPCPRQPGHLYRCAVWTTKVGCTFDLPTWINVWHGAPPAAGYAPNTWVEVTHCVSTIEENQHMGTWFYAQKGSGMWLNVGNTVVFGDHKNAVAAWLHLNPYRRCSRHGKHCEGFFSRLGEEARNRGLHTIQYVRHNDMRCGNTHLEIVWIREDDPWKSFRGGLNASCGCELRSTPTQSRDLKYSCWHCHPTC